jgi:hypothetical protein
MKAALQYDTQEHAEAAAEVLRKHSIRYEVAAVKADGSVAYPDFIDVGQGGVVLFIEDADWERGMQLIWDANP